METEHRGDIISSQTTQWPKEQVENDKQRSAKHAHCILSKILKTNKQL
jgi:hypothetical protein